MIFKLVGLITSQYSGQKGHLVGAILLAAHAYDYPLGGKITVYS